MSLGERFFVPRAQRTAFYRDAQLAATRSAVQGLCIAIAVQVVLGMGGDERHSAWMHTGPFLGLIFSVFYVQIGARFSPMKLLLVSDGLAALSLFSVGLYGLGLWEGDRIDAAPTNSPRFCSFDLCIGRTDNNL